MASLARDYLATIRDVRATGAGTDELSYYPALQQLLNHLGGKLKPRVFCVSQLADQGAGQPDYGLYTKNQTGRMDLERITEGLVPERGVIEAKAPAAS